jgi:hypothetical protein
MLHGVADLLPTILFVPDPIGRLLCNSVRNAGRVLQSADEIENGYARGVWIAAKLYPQARLETPSNKPGPLS